MTVKMKSQTMAHEAYQRIMERKPESDYKSFAREFPTLVHSCGLAQAVAFALAKRNTKRSDGGPQFCYANDLATVLNKVGFDQIGNAEELAEQTRTLPVTGYLRLSRNALLATDWLKRYVEAAGEQPASSGGK
jgi:CRISPR-associated protein Cmr5